MTGNVGRNALGDKTARITRPACAFEHELSAGKYHSTLARNGCRSQGGMPGLSNSFHEFCFNRATRQVIPVSSDDPVRVVIGAQPRQREHRGGSAGKV
ncbi:hypothetical protein [Rhodobaculum claviforme]|uniref:hypothetical protein n=1 Tax=Rhodobaculum claviforme TaxID=1549854 RepID=UPI0019120937|nr:hypothetical protein [Rhodobaculum claviforme]